jgi:membrane-associated phospholipid phosphatase
MKSDHDYLQRADRLIWTVIATIAGTLVLSSLGGPFVIDWASFQLVTILSLVLCTASSFYANVRKDPLAASALRCTAQIALFAAVGAPLSYIAASAGLPLWDNSLVAWDLSLGLDWMAWLAFMNKHPTLHWICVAAYSSFLFQTAITVLALAVTGHIVRLRLYVLSFILATLIMIAVSAVMPAQGVWGYLKLSPENYPAITPVTEDLHLAVFRGLRDGSFRHLVARGAEGIITFPSLHTAGGLLFIFAMWPVKYLRWIAMLLNITMIAATPIDGGHYFSDVIAGAVVAALCWAAARRLLIKREVAATEMPIAEAVSIVPDIVAKHTGKLTSPEFEPSRRHAPPVT